MPVPAEHLGRARQLRRDLAAAAKASREATERLLAPLRRGIKRRGSPRAEEIAGFVRAWRLSVPPQNRVSLSIQMEGGVALIDETMLLSSELSRPATWGADQWEPGICMASASIRLGRRKAEMTERDLIAFSLHSIGRRFERGASAADRTEAAVMHDLCALSVHHPDALPAGGFNIPASAGLGFWVGERIDVNGKPVAVIRTFLGPDMAP